jgi:hypothetical protein
MNFACLWIIEVTNSITGTVEPIRTEDGLKMGFYSRVNAQNCANKHVGVMDDWVTRFV